MFCKLAKSFSTNEIVEKKEKKQQSDTAGGGAEAKKTPIYLNVYDISPINKYLYWFGLGIYHSGIQGNNFDHFSALLASFPFSLFYFFYFFFHNCTMLFNLKYNLLFKPPLKYKLKLEVASVCFVMLYALGTHI